MANIDNEIVRTEKHLQELKSQKTSENEDPKDKEIKFLKSKLHKGGIKLVKNNCHGNSLDYNFNYQLDQGKKDDKKGLAHDFDESKNHWTFSHLGNLYEDYLNDGCCTVNEWLKINDDSDDNSDEDSDGYVNHIFF